MLRDLCLQNFRCFESRTFQFDSGFNFIVGPNGRGKTTILEGTDDDLRWEHKDGKVWMQS